MKINDVAVDDLTPEQAAEIIRSLLTAAGFHTHTHTHTHGTTGLHAGAGVCAR